MAASSSWRRRKYHADATGVELDTDLVQSEPAKIRQLGLQKTARIIYGDILKQNYSSANLIPFICCRNPTSKCGRSSRPAEKRHARSWRTISKSAAGPRSKRVTIPDDGEGRSHTLYLYL